MSAERIQGWRFEGGEVDYAVKAEQFRGLERDYQEPRFRDAAAALASYYEERWTNL